MINPTKKMMMMMMMQTTKRIDNTIKLFNFVVEIRLIKPWSK